MRKDYLILTSIHCDKPGCDRRVHIKPRKLARGWVSKGGRDYCPACAAKLKEGKGSKP